MKRKLVITYRIIVSTFFIWYLLFEICAQGKRNKIECCIKFLFIKAIRSQILPRCEMNKIRK